MLNKSTVRFDLQLPTFSGWDLAFLPFSNIPGDPFGNVNARYGTLWHGYGTVRATFMHVMARYDTLWHVMVPKQHNVQETGVKRVAFLAKAYIYIKKTSVNHVVFA